MRIIAFPSIDDTCHPEPSVDNRLTLTKMQILGFKLPFERYILKALARIDGSSESFFLSSGIIVKSAQEDCHFHTGYGPTLTVKKDQTLLQDSVLIWGTWQLNGSIKPRKQLLLTRLTLGWAHQRYLDLFDGRDDTDIAPERGPIIVEELARFVHQHIVTQTKRMKSECAEVATDHFLNHQKTLANYERLGDFLKAFDPHH